MAVVYGSMATGFAFEESDLDLSLQGMKLDNRGELDARIESLGKALSSCKMVTQCQPIATARVPIIKLVSNETNSE